MVTCGGIPTGGTYVTVRPLYDRAHEGVSGAGAHPKVVCAWALAESEICRVKSGSGSRGKTVAK